MNSQPSAHAGRTGDTRPNGPTNPETAVTLRPPPRFVGVMTYVDPGGRFFFRFPVDWTRFDLEDREGVGFMPDPADRFTTLTAWATPLEHAAVADDLPVLKRGLTTGFDQLPGCVVEDESEVLIDNLIRFERVYRFQDGEAVRKRKVRIFYADRWQIVLCWQGSSPAEFDYWLPMANYAFATFSLTLSLYFATDKERDRLPIDPTTVLPKDNR